MRGTKRLITKIAKKPKKHEELSKQPKRQQSPGVKLQKIKLNRMLGEALFSWRRMRKQRTGKLVHLLIISMDELLGIFNKQLSRNNLPDVDIIGLEIILKNFMQANPEVDRYFLDEYTFSPRDMVHIQWTKLLDSKVLRVDFG